MSSKLGFVFSNTYFYEMNLQEIIAFLILLVAIGYLVKKFFWTPKKKSKNCATNEDCACH